MLFSLQIAPIQINFFFKFLLLYLCLLEFIILRRGKNEINQVIYWELKDLYIVKRELATSGLILNFLCVFL